MDQPSDPENSHATAAENARFAAFAASLERDGFSPITRACYASDWWTVSEHAHRSTGRKFRLGAFGPDGFLLQRAELAARGSSPATLNRRLSFLRKYSAFAAQSEPALREAAVGFAALPFQSVPKRTTTALTHAEEQRIRASADSIDRRCGALIALLLGTGLRAGEVAALTRADVIGPRSAPTGLRIGGERPKTVLLGPYAQERIAGLLRHESAGDGRPIFRAKAGAALGEDGVAAAVERAARAAGVDATPRTLRHTFAVRYLSDHAEDLDGLAEALGHVSLASVRAYRAEAESKGSGLQVRSWSDLDDVTPAPRVQRRSLTGSRVVVVRDALSQGAEIAVNASATERITIVLSGRVAFRTGANRVEAGAGNFVSVPSGTAHGIETCDDRPAVLLHVFASPRRGEGRPAK